MDERYKKAQLTKRDIYNRYIVVKEES